MGSFGVFTQRTGRLVTLAALVTATLGQGLLPTLASAAQVTARSVALSSSSVSATNVTYQVNFTSVSAAGAFVVQFCGNTPLIGQSCTAPTGFDATGVTTATSGATISGTATANKVIVADTIGSASSVTVALDNIKNPTAAGTIYARVVTYASTTDAGIYSADGTTLGTVVDQGSMAMSITNTVGVSGAVLESMTFCVAGATISPDCNLSGNSAPTLQLGKNTGGVIALDPTAVYTGTIYTQISTNAASGAIVNLKSDALNCGGLLRAGSPAACDIPAAGVGANTVVASTPGFGVMTGANVTGADGTYEAVPSGSYNASDYHMNFVAGNTAGVTSTYGDPILDTASAPANNLNMPLTFGATVSNNTPAGLYAANLSLVATGKF